ncbi:putative DNA replication licensing factor, putative,minichromosome maintenance protein-like protein [Trypanosoma conorhini]|uniref:Putative DNA replication licensing factor, putative,minichromosome maintenance protein-like protein n=1 Tax=Trypanosoma conorhini TaxID=83891 RepID=A0A422NUA4_9TRYP|nr:putative DNA replication licensing factor, putative,minichromosome maintenance protein-like protein [Trypanosoma conorhini]RNF09045.1 putative DNA replication licensing factor, putative,minichromosome maintenance protein-like protein [Trypanosoma conorhini]
MSISGIPQETVKVLWQVHCASLAPLSFGEEIVGEMWKLFAGFLASLPLQSAAVSSNHASLTLSLFTFTVDLRSEGLTAEMRTAIVNQPHIIVPLLEFFRAVLDYQQQSEGHPRGAVGCWQLICSVIADDACARSFDALGASLLGQLVRIRGTVVRMSPSRVVCVKMAFRCGSCGGIVECATEDGILVYPGSCRGRCRGYKWSPLVEQGECEEVQVLKIQEQADVYDGSAGGGSIHKMMTVELRGVWIDAATVGEAVVVCGVLAARRGEGRGDATQQIAVRAYSIEGSRHDTERGVSLSMNSLEESAQFYEMVRHPQWFARLCASLAPSIFGLQHVKEAIVLAVVGGTAHKMRTRSNIHLLMVGDPGLGKSQLLRSACTIAARSAFVCAHTSSSCGLTLTLTRDPTTGETSFEAGAVVHGDGGITCIDEIDKGVTEHRALLEVMEQETVSMAKAGMVFSVPVRTAILAAGNPAGGRFDDSKAVTANLNLSPALLSRFDIVVCLRDPHTECTNSLSEHVLRLHRRHDEAGARHAGGAGGGMSLPVELVQRFVAFCRHHCHPSLREEASEVLKSHYLTRRAETRDDELPVTPRFLQALIRVAEARAKVELRHEVTADDAQYAVGLLRQCSGSLRGTPRTSFFRPATAKKMSQRDLILNTLKAEVCRTGVNAFPHRVVLAACEEAGCRNANAMLHQLNEVGVILQIGDKYQLRGV